MIFLNQKAMETEEYMKESQAHPTGEVRQSSTEEIVTETDVLSWALTKRGARLKATFNSHHELNLQKRHFSHS